MRRFLLFALALAVAVVSHGQQTVIWTSGTYSYDGAGNIRSIGTDKYSYDSLGRLKSANLSFPGGTATQTFTYDGFGNLTSIDTTPNLPTYLKTEPIPVNPATNQLTGRTYDAAGNVTVDGVETYEWDATGAMIARRVTGEEDWLYLYTASDERIAVFRGELKAAGQSGFLTTPTKVSWTIRDLDAKPMAVWESSGGTYGLATITWKRDYVWGFGRLMATIDATGTRHVHTDHLGTPRLITNASGGIVEEHEYYPFGFEATTEGSEPIKFTGHERDLEPYSNNDLDYMHARYYSPVMGRFLSVDPKMTIKKNLAEPQRWNRYAYVENNPIRKLDPDGRSSFDIQQDTLAEMYASGQIGRQELVEATRCWPCAAAGGIAAAVMAAPLAGSAILSSSVTTAVLSHPQWWATAGAVATGVDTPSVGRTRSIIGSGQNLIGREGSSRAIRYISGGLRDAQKLFIDIAKGGKVEKAGENFIRVAVEGGYVVLRTKSSEEGVEAVIQMSIRGIGVRELKFK